MIGLGLLTERHKYAGVRFSARGREYIQGFIRVLKWSGGTWEGARGVSVSPPELCEES